MTDEFICDTLELRRFVGNVQTIIVSTPSIPERLAAIRPLFSKLIVDPHWLPNEFHRTYEHGGMVKGIANWLLYRDTDGTLSLSALVLPHRAATPVHDHLAVGSFYELIPPIGDIHRVITTSPAPSISLHLLGNEVGCILRHRFSPGTGAVAPFRSGRANKDCECNAGQSHMGGN